MKTIYKYVIPIQDRVVMPMKAGAEVIHVGAQGPNLCLWAVVDPSADDEDRNFRIAGTGHPLDDDWDHHHGSVQMGMFVWHVLEASP